MNQIDHCLLCDNSERNIQQGVFCGLTGNKPSFGAFCEKIELSQNMLKRIEQISFEYELSKSKKWLSITNFVFFLLLAVGMFFAGYALWNLVYQQGFISTLPLVIMFFALTLLPLSIGPLRKYIYERNNNRKKINEVGGVLNKYGLAYKPRVKLEKQNHNILEVEIEILVKKNGKTIQKYSNRFDYNNNEKRVENYSFGTYLIGGGEGVIL